MNNNYQIKEEEVNIVCNQQKKLISKLLIIFSEGKHRWQNIQNLIEGKDL